MEKYNLSIVIPMYNAACYISECLESILSQNLPTNSYEIIIINDGSTDHSEDIVRQYLTKYSQIKLHSQDNAGQSVARNKGIYLAKGRYICFIDADDFLFPNSLSAIYDLLFGKDSRYVQIQNCDIITYGIKGGPDVNFQTLNAKSKDEELIVEETLSGPEYIGRYNYNNGPWYYLIKKQFLEKHNLKFEVGKLCEDGMFTLNAFINASTMIHVRKDVYYYVERPNSTTTTLSPERRRKIIEGFIYAVDFFSTVLKNKQEIMNAKCKQRIITRRDSYIAFLLIRLIKAGSIHDLLSVIKILKSKGLYPIKNLYGEDYPGTKFKVLSILLNQKIILASFIPAMRLLKWIRNL